MTWFSSARQFAQQALAVNLATAAALAPPPPATRPAPRTRHLTTPAPLDAATCAQFAPQYTPGTPLVVATGVVCHHFRRTGRHVLVSDGTPHGFQVVEVLRPPRSRARRIKLPSLGTALPYGDTGTVGPLADPARFPYWVAVR